MAEPFINAMRDDPYKNFKFRVMWNGRYVAGFSKISSLKRTTEMIEHREGGDPSTSHKSPGRTKVEPITLERGLTHDLEFVDWANRIWNADLALGAESSLSNFRKDIQIDLHNEAGQRVLSYTAYRCFPSELTALPELDANGNAVAILSLRLEAESWSRDTDVPEPTEPPPD